MGWQIGYDTQWKRDIGYGVPALCDHPDCNEVIDRGLGFVCAEQRPYGGENGCGLFFCEAHSVNSSHQCERCAGEQLPFEAKPDVRKWVRWKLTHHSWEEWREQNPDEVLRLQVLANGPPDAAGDITEDDYAE